MIQIAIETYQELMNIYSNEIQHLQKLFNKSDIHNKAIPEKVINSRVTVFDEYLLNPYHSKLDYEIKQKLMPFIVKHIASLDLLSENEMTEFIKLRPKNNYTENLNSLIQDFFPIIEFINNNIKNERIREIDLTIPHRSTKGSANSQIIKYKSEMKEYKESKETIKKNILEMENLQESYEKILQELKKNINLL